MKFVKSSLILRNAIANHHVFKMSCCATLDPENICDKVHEASAEFPLGSGFMLVFFCSSDLMPSSEENLKKEVKVRRP